jgi:predicted AAA+ superfamily ATPase
VEGYRDREVYDSLGPFLRQPQVVALTGLRRTGKTTILHRVVEDAIAGGRDPKDVLYFSFDEFRGVRLREVLGEYEAATGRDVRSGRFLVLLDEVQKVEAWADELKALYDAHKGRVKFVASGSESLFLRKGSKETLAGRLFEFRVDPLSFREYLVFRGIRHKPPSLYERELVRAFDAFVLTQGFPELVDVTERAVVRRYLRESIVEKVVFRDLPALLDIRDLAVLESLVNLLMEDPGQIIQISELAGTLAVSRDTLSNYLAYLEQSFLVRKLYNFSTGRRKVERKLRRYYPTIVSPDLAFRDDDLSRSRVFGWAVVSQLRAEYFWRDAYKNEVDVVLPGKKPIPLEINSGEVETRGVEAFLRKFRADTGYVVTRDQEGERAVDGGRIRIVPAYRFLLEGTTLLTSAEH